MQRKEAEKLLAALIFDDLDEASKTELLNYLQTDNELRERLADMRMAAKVASDTVQHGPDPVLGKRRLKHLARLARHQRSWTTFLTAPRLAAAAAIFIIGIVGLAMLQPALQKASERGIPYATLTTKIEADYDERGERGSTSTWTRSQVPTGPSSESRRTPEITFTGGQSQNAYEPSVRGLDIMDMGYAYDPAVTGPVVAGSGAVITGTIANDGRLFARGESGRITNAEISLFSGDVHSSGRSGPTDKLDSGSIVAGSSFESKPHSGVTISGGDGSYDVGGHRGGGYWGYGGGYGDKNGDGISSAYNYSGGGFGGMGGYGGMGVSGGGMGGYGGYGGGGYRGSRYDWIVGNGGYYDYSGPGEKGGSGGDAVSGVISGDTLGVTNGTHDADIVFKGGKTNLFTKPDAFGIAADGDNIVVDGRVTFQNGQAVGTTTDGSTVNIIDNFEGVSNATAPSPVTVVAGKPVTITAPELAPPWRLEPMKDVSGKTDLPELKLQSGSEESRVVWQDTNGDMRPWWTKEAHDKSEAVSKEIDYEQVDKGYHYLPEKVQPVKPPVPGFPGSNLVEQGSRRGDVSREVDEAEIPYSAVISTEDSKKYIEDFLESTGRDEKSVSSLEKVISEFPQPTDEIKALLGTKTKQSADHESSIPAEGPAGKGEKSRRTVPILGDIPIVGHMYSDAYKKRPLTEEEEKQIIAHFEDRKSQPKGEPAGLEYETIKLKHADPREVEALIEDGFRNLPGTESLPGVSIESLPQDQQIIVFGSKDQRETVKKMVQAIDNKLPQVRIDATIVRTGEDETDLPAASRFKLVPVNPWVMAERDSLSTFALDVDTASYTLCRRYIRGGFLPPAGAVRIEEFVNYFNYHYPQRTNPTFAVHAEAAPSPFARREQNLTLLKIGVKARTIGRDQRKAAHLIFVVDASASMDQPDRLPLIQRALGLLVNKLSAVDRVSLITCASEARLHIETVPARERGRIRQAINAIQPAGPTNLLAGLKLGYATARRTFAPKQINHVVLCSDGVANVGQTEAEAVLNEVAEDRKQGITITCVGVGYGSYNDAFLEALANQGDGSYMFLDSLRQVHRVFVRQLAATLQTVARDARIQVDFNPDRVRRYRLIGYENRDIEDERFRDDTIDAGEVGSGQCSTALYELELIGQPSADRQEDLGTVFVRYLDVETGQFEEISSRLSSAIVRRLTVESAPRFFLAAGAARFAEILRQSEHAQDGNLMDVFRVVEQVSLALPLDRDVRELAELIRKSENLPRSP
jgi:Ca-activated chloride channel family protein